MALAMVLGFTQCKKEHPLEPQGEQVRITLDVSGNDNNGSKVNVNPPHVTFESGDQILVGYDGHYVGTITHNGSQFEGNIEATVSGSQPLYFYFVGNKNKSASISVGDNTYTVDISNQSAELPVLSFSESNEVFNGPGSYTARLHNQCALVELTLTSGTTAAVGIGDRYTEATINFGGTPGIAPNTSTTGMITMKPSGEDNTKKYAILLPQAAVAGSAIAIGHVGYTLGIPAMNANDYNKFSNEGAAASNIVYLNYLTSSYTATDGQTLTGTLGSNIKISIADGATVTLDNATINGTDNFDYLWSGLNCVGNATIILADGSENTVRGFDNHKAGIFFPEKKTLTIQGSTGRLNVSSNGWAAGIGGSYGIDCGNISIEGGIITATGSYQCPGIGASSSCGTITITGGTITSTGGEEAPGIGARNCGKITITGGTVEAMGGQYGAGIGCKKDGITDGIEIGGTANVAATGGEKAAGIGSAYCVGRNGTCGNISIGGTATVTATGGSKAAGIGSGYGFGSSSISSCGTITIANTVTSVTATKGTDATNSIGKGEGSNSTCGTVTIGSTEGAITESPYTYPTPPPTGAINGKFTINAGGDQVYFSQGNLQAVFASAGSSCTWQFAANQWDYIGIKPANNKINGNGSVSAAGTVDLFGWSTAATTYGIHNSKVNETYSGSFKDWGTNAITNGGNTANSWRTPTNDEWTYFMNTRPGATVDATANARYTDATINTDVSGGVNGRIMFPDGVTFATDEATTWGTINANSDWTTKCTAAQWTALETKGCVFMPAAGYRTGIEGGGAGERGRYWLATEKGDDSAYSSFFGIDSGTAANDYYRRFGRSVRLVKDAN